jgi:uncharacterized protein (DUF427 family)
VVADSIDALVLEEKSYPPVYYVPRKDVKMERLVRSSHHTRCPHKGEASYFSFKDGPANAVWSYEDPIPQAAAIKDHLAFYPDKVSIDSSGD